MSQKTDDDRAVRPSKDEEQTREREKTVALAIQLMRLIYSRYAQTQEVIGMKKPNLNYARNMDIDAWRERQIQKRLAACLALREQRFIREHGGDTDDELREYVRGMAQLMRRMPHPMELAGGEYLKERLGDWNTLARCLGYRPADSAKGKLAYQRLKQQEEEAFSAERRARKEEKQRRKTNREHAEQRAAAAPESL